MALLCMATVLLQALLRNMCGRWASVARARQRASVALPGSLRIKTKERPSRWAGSLVYCLDNEPSVRSTIMKRMGTCVAILALLAMAGRGVAQENIVLDVWPGKVPGEDGKIGEEKVLDPKAGEKQPVKRVTNVTRPTIAVFRPTKAKD